MSDKPVIVVPDEGVLDQVAEGELERLPGESDADFAERKRVYAMIKADLMADGK